MDGLRNALDSVRSILVNDLDFLGLGEGMAPAIYIIALCTVLILVGFIIALIFAGAGKMSKFKQNLDDTTAFVNANGIVDEENVGGVYQRIKTMPRSVNEGWGHFMEQQAGKPSDYISEKEVLGARKDNPSYAAGSKFFKVFSSIIILLGIIAAAIGCVDALYNIADDSTAFVKFALPVIGTMAAPWLIYVLLNAILSGVNKGKFNKLRASFISFQDALDSNVIIFNEEQDEFITENIEEINAAIEDILANKLTDSEILEIVTTPKIDERYVVEEAKLPEMEVSEEKPVVEEVKPAQTTQQSQVAEEINKGERLVQLVFIADKASRDPNATAEQLEELVIYLETVRTSGDYDDPEEQSVFVDCLTMVSGAYFLRFGEDQA
ncbi:MAG: hypothetical protein BWX72_00834 [Firmicutes bacterium ADurb.Bin080]|nr:MAG: hypothetical protein BWX72_00834 [Firmicutes bacterium ADurb.Bin080]